MMPLLVPASSPDQTSHVAPHFDHLDLQNAVVPLMVLYTSYDANTNAVMVLSSNVITLMSLAITIYSLFIYKYTSSMDASVLCYSDLYML